MKEIEAAAGGMAAAKQKLALHRSVSLCCLHRFGTSHIVRAWEELNLNRPQKSIPGSLAS